MNELQPTPAHEARTAGDRTDPVVLRAWLIVGLGFGAFLGVIGALESYGYSLPLRIGFWTLLCLIAASAAAGLERLLDSFAWRGARSLKRWAVLSIGLTAVMTPVAYLSNSLGGARPLSELAMFFVNALVISTMLVALRAMLGEVLAARRARWQARAASDPRPAFRDRLPLPLKDGRIRALQAEGHYVRVFTDRGNDLVLFRLKDSINELDGIDGRRVHRSWWVARAAVRRVKRRNGRTWLILDDELKVPVSRSNLGPLRDAGWI